MRFSFTRTNHLLSLSVAFLVILAFPLTVNGQELFELMEKDGVELKKVQAAAKSYFDKVGRGPGSGYKLYKRWEYSAQLKVQADGMVMSKKAQAYAVEQIHSNVKSGNKSLGNWTELGPLSYEVTSGYAPGVGRVTACYIEPVQQQLMYVGSPGGGFWKSVNGGNSWSPIGDQFNDMEIWAIGVDPNVANKLYIADNVGLMVSTDGGSTFTRIPQLINTGKITTILVEPGNSNVIYVAMRYVGLFKTTDGGASWNQLVTGTVEDIIYKPGNMNVMYACGNSFYRSTDGGNSFTAVNNGIQSSTRMKLAITQADTNMVYIVQDHKNSSGTWQFGFLYRSVDGGSSFSVQTDHTDTNGRDYIGRQSYRDMAIAVSHTDANEVHIGGLHMFKSLDGGQSFTQQCHWVWGKTKLGNPSETRSYVHADIEIIRYVNNTLYVGSDGGLFRSTNQGSDFADLTSGMGIHQLYRIGNSHLNKDLMASGAQDNGLNMMVASQHKWRHWYGADGMECWIHPKNDSMQIAATQYGNLIRTDNGGFSRYRPNKPPQHGQGNWLTPMAVESNTGNRVYVGYDTLYRHDNFGDTAMPWVNCSKNFQFVGKLSHIELCPNNIQYIYVAAQSRVYKSTNILSANPTWQYMAGTVGGNVNDIAVDPFNENRVAVCTSVGFVYLSENGGQSWTRMDSALPSVPFKAIVFDKTNSRGMYLATDGAVYYRNDNLGHWTLFDNGLPHVETRELEIYYGAPGESRLRVATYGRGAWETPLYEDLVSGIEIRKPDFEDLLVYPNPAQDLIRVEFQSPGGDVNIQLHDLMGKQVKSTGYHTHHGLNHLKVPVQEIQPGAYILTIASSVGNRVVRKVTVSR